MTIISLPFVTFVSGNGYYIPKANEQGLNVKISLQTSRDNRGRKDTSARYATAWLDHGVNPTNKGYEYAIIVGTKPSTIRVNMYTFTTNLTAECYYYAGMFLVERAFDMCC